VRRLHDAGIAFAVTSGRPPRGMEMLVEPLALTTPIAAFNGGMFIDDTMHVLSQRTIPDAADAPVLGICPSSAVSMRGSILGRDWLVRRLAATHVEAYRALPHSSQNKPLVTPRDCPPQRGKRASRYGAVTAPMREYRGSRVSYLRPRSKRRRRGCCC
jgi:hypothetical protein